MAETSALASFTPSTEMPDQSTRLIAYLIAGDSLLLSFDIIDSDDPSNTPLVDAMLEPFVGKTLEVHDSMEPWVFAVASQSPLLDQQMTQDFLDSLPCPPKPAPLHKRSTATILAPAKPHIPHIWRPRPPTGACSQPAELIVPLPQTSINLPPPTSTEITEPSTAALLAVGLIALTKAGCRPRRVHRRRTHRVSIVRAGDPCPSMDLSSSAAANDSPTWRAAPAHCSAGPRQSF